MLRLDNDGSIQFSTVDASGANAYISIADPWIHTTNQYQFNLVNNHIANINIIDDGLEIEIDTSVFEPVVEDGKITLRRMFDEESNASQDNRTHEESSEGGAHSSPDMLQFSSTIQYTQR